MNVVTFRSLKNQEFASGVSTVDKMASTKQPATGLSLSSYCNAWFNFTCYHSPPGNPGDKSSPLGPGMGNSLKRSFPGGRGVEQIENNFLLFL